MKILVYLMTAKKIRYVEIPDVHDTNEVLDAVFHYGQNEFQPQPLPSVDNGDIVSHPNGGYYLIEDGGFHELPDWKPPIVISHPKRNPRKSKKSMFGDCSKACDPELCRLLKPYMRNPYQSRNLIRRANPRKKRSMFGDCSKACDPELCRLLKPYMQRYRRRYY